MARALRPSGARVEVFAREEFLADRWVYSPGEHVTLLAPTQAGKTTLAFQLAEVTATPKLPAVVAVIKPRDPTVDRWAKRLRYPIVRSWPPQPSVFRPRKPAGWMLWPRHQFDPDADDARLYREMRRAILDAYKRGRRILLLDETYGLSKELGLDRELVTVWSRGASMGTGLWAASQKPSHIPLWAYSQAAHLFLANDPDKRARDRFGEIGGVDPVLVDEVVKTLPPHHFLYIRRRGPALAIIAA